LGLADIDARPDYPIISRKLFRDCATGKALQQEIAIISVSVAARLPFDFA